MTEDIKLKHLKLSNNEEIICEIIEWKNPTILMRGAMVLTKGDDIESGIRFWSLRPWLGLTDNISSIQTLNSSHIIGESLPSSSLIKHYVSTVKQVLNNEKENKLIDIKLDDIYDMNFSTNDEYISEYDSNQISDIKLPTTYH